MFYFGEPIGIIVWKVWYPAVIHGHHNYATTYEFPVRIKFIENYRAPKGKEEEWAGWNLPEYIRCAKELEEEGVCAITTNCGLTGTIQKELADAVNVPVFTSSLLLVPLIHRMLGKNKKVGILVSSAKYARAQNYRLLRSCGIDESIPYVLYGMDESEYVDVWNSQFRGLSPEYSDVMEYDPKKVEQAVALTAKKMVSEHPDIGAIVLECTEMPLYAAAVREATGLPVFDSTTLVRFVYYSIVKKRYF